MISCFVSQAVWTIWQGYPDCLTLATYELHDYIWLHWLLVPYRNASAVCLNLMCCLQGWLYLPKLRFHVMCELRIMAIQFITHLLGEPLQISDRLYLFLIGVNGMSSCTADATDASTSVELSSRHYIMWGHLKTQDFKTSNESNPPANGVLLHYPTFVFPIDLLWPV